jgi:DNA-binding LytR/AlgR family response regulator
MNFKNKTKTDSVDSQVEIAKKSQNSDAITVPQVEGLIRIAMCDDKEEELLILKKSIESYCTKRPEYTYQFHSFYDPLQLLNYIKKYGSFDILLLDIYMPYKKGTQVAELLREKNDQCEIIFITSSDDHAHEAYKVNAIQYIKKPFQDDDICNAMNRGFNLLGKKPSKTLLLKTTEGLRRLNTVEIFYTKAKGHYQRIFLSDGTIYKTRMTVQELFELLCTTEKFMRISTAFIVAIRHILSINVKEITLKNGVSIPLQRNTYKKVKEKYLNLIFEEL